MIKLSKYLLRQRSEVLAGGGIVFLRKVRSLIIKVICLITKIPLVLSAYLIVALRPLIVVRFGTLQSDRIGHFSVDTEAYLCSLKKKKSNQRTFDIIGCANPGCNHQLRLMWGRVIHIVPGAWLWDYLDRICRRITQSDLHHLKLEDIHDQSDLFPTTPKHISFTPEEDRRGREVLEQLGIPVGVPWVCIHNRDAAYLGSSQPSVNWSYHDYRDFSVQSMVPAAE